MSKQLPVMEQFYTIQGEGRYAGTPAYFIRLGGCNIGCHWCDVKESWDGNAYPKITVDQIVNQIPEKARLVIITGGEPCEHDLTDLTTKIKSKGIQINLETSGAYEIKGYFDWICLSPKKQKLPLDSSLKKAHELKVVIYNQNDFQFAENFTKKVSSSCKRYLQVEWSKRNELKNQVIRYAMENPVWNVSTQIHKYLNIR
ncbi:MAG: 7-carboxy-7-deazaguanine synthase QueE [Flavobacteriales bacterium]